MKLRKVHIENFRGIKSLDLDLDETVVFIGENNSGKTAVLDALRLCLRDLGPRRRVVFDPYDFHLKDAAAEPAGSDPIVSELTFSEDTAGDWGNELIGSLNRQRILQVDGTDRSYVILRVTCTFNVTTRDFDQDWQFLNLQGQTLQGVPDTALGTLQREVTYFYLSALRDAARHFDANGPFWKPFLKDSQLAPEKKTDIETKLREVNDLVVQSHASFDQARNRLKKVQDVVPMASGDVVSIEAVPGRLFDVLAKAQINLSTTTDAKVPVGRHGEGTQSLAVLMLFSAFLDTRSSGTPIIALEEPEAHLHPSAVRTLWNVLNGINGQKLITTHSGELLSEVPVRSIRRLSRAASGIQLHMLNPNTLSANDERKLDFHIRYARGELLFARCWLLVEGETEVTLLPEIAQHLGISLDRIGVRCVPHRHVGIELFLKVARDFGIKWCAFTDNDSQGAADRRHATAYATGANLADVLHVMPALDIEQYLCSVGFGSIYASYLSSQTRPAVTSPPEHLDYWPQVIKAIKNSYSKPAAAMEVIARILSGAAEVPPVLENAIRAAVRLAEE